VTSLAASTRGALRAAVADPTQVKTRPLDLHANAHDASHLLLIPQAVVVARNADEVGQLLRASAAQGMPLTFRSGGTSLIHQTLTDRVWWMSAATSEAFRTRRSCSSLAHGSRSSVKSPGFHSDLGLLRPSHRLQRFEAAERRQHVGPPGSLP
jgi:hypothetical protein